MSPLERLYDAFRERWESFVDRAPDLFLAILVLAIFIALGRVAARLLDRLLVRGRLSSTHRAFFRGLVAWTVGLLGLAMALSVLGLSGLAAGLVTSGGITAIVIGFAFRGIGENLLAGFFLAFSRPFEVGDYIESEGLAGTVRGIELRSTHIRTPDGRDIYIPSAQIFNSPLVNFTKDGYRRPSFRVGVDYRDDLAGARAVLLAAVRQVDGVLESPAPTVYLVGTEPNFVQLEAALWIDTVESTLARVRSDAIEAGVTALAAAGFTFSSEVSTGIEVLALPDGPADPSGATDAARPSDPASD